MSITVNDMRKWYPNPTAAPQCSEAGVEAGLSDCDGVECSHYCVAGALLKVLGWEHDTGAMYPDAGLVADYLHHHLDLLEETALTTAHSIIAANDSSQFEQAWELVDQAIADSKLLNYLLLREGN
jgi:hypothetical protein